MASYIVLARKWRPQTFADLVGQQHIAVTLRNAIAQNRVAHAFLFTGSRGVGKTSTARIFAKALNCVHSPCDEPCNECESCREITEGHSMDVIEIDGASNRGINEIREVLDAVRYAPSRDRYKIYIIDEVHMLTTEAFNALLKTLEEPPSHVVFIFATTDPNKIPITIVSRCQRYDFKRINTDDLVAHLAHIAEEEKIQFEESALRLIARTARGGLRDALSAMDQIIAFAEQPINGERAAEVLGVASRETLMKMGECVARRDVDGALSCIEKVDHYGQNLSQFAFDLLEFWRDVTVMCASPNAPVELNATEKGMISEWLNLMTFDRLQRIFNIWYQTSEQLPKSLSPRLVMEMATIKMCQVESVVPIDGILRRIDALARAIGGSQSMTPDALKHVEEFLGSKSLGNKKKKSEFVGLKIGSDIAVTESGGLRASAAGAPARNVDSLQKESIKPAVVPEPVKTVAKPAVSMSDGAASPSMPSKVNTESKPVAESGDAAAPKTAAGNVGGPGLDEPLMDFDIPWEEGGSPISEADLADMGGDWGSYEDEESGDDGEDEKVPGNSSNVKKTLEVSGDSPKTARPAGGSEKAEIDPMYRWKQLVSRLGKPLSLILARARVDCFSRNCVEVTLPTVYRGMVSQAHVHEIERYLAREVYSGCLFAVHYDEIGDESETLAAQEAKAQLDAQQEAFNRVSNHPLMKRIIEVFHVESETIRFTINPDRTSK